MGVRCFLVTCVGRARRYLRRYVQHAEGVCPGPHGYHQAWTLIDVVEEHVGTDGYFPATPQDWDPQDPRWPLKCQGCDYVFLDTDIRQVFHDHLYIDAGGVDHSLRDRTPGMMWDAHWMPECWRGPDGRSLCVVCPGGTEWMIDGPASNCTMPSDQGPFDRAHRCWVRHGEPPNITVDKNGRTCHAGAGSIQAGQYHGFLRNGEFTD